MHRLTIVSHYRGWTLRQRGEGVLCGNRHQVIEAADEFDAKDVIDALEDAQAARKLRLRPAPWEVQL
jgi:hypothetical protein